MSVTRAPGGDHVPLIRSALDIERGTVVRGAVIAALFAAVVVVLPSMVGADWITTLTSVAIYSVVALGLGIFSGASG